MKTVNRRAWQFERRIVTIMATDVADYCRHMAADDELTLSRFLAYRQVTEHVIRSNRGRMFGVAGDSWMAEFPLPLDAVRAAIETQRAIERRNFLLPEENRIRLRIGLHMGDVMVDTSGLFGDEVNIAARLQQICAPGHLMLSEAVFHSVESQIDVSFNALGPRQLKNIFAPVSAFSVNPGVTNGETGNVSRDAAIEQAQRHDRTSALAVLPFHVHGDGPADEFGGEAFAGSLINGLSRLRWLPVLSQWSSLRFMSGRHGPCEIGRALGTRYLVTGRLKLSGSELRVTINLIDAGCGHNLWGRTFALDPASPATAQDDFTTAAVSALEVELERAEFARLSVKKKADLNAWELSRRGTWHLKKLTREHLDIAVECFRAAVERDPGSSEALIQLATCGFAKIWMHRHDAALLRETETLARKACLLDPQDARVYLVIAFLKLVTRAPERARTYLQRSLDLNPSFAMAHCGMGSSYTLAGEPANAIAHYQRAMRLSPCDPLTFHFLGETALAYHLLGEWEAAVDHAERALNIRARYRLAKVVQIATLGRTGEVAKARAEVKAWSGAFLHRGIERLPFSDGRWNSTIIEGLRLAGCDADECEREK
ncbi:tetratricopeptide repeat protein [Rhodomicrobium sp. Az07]|uniref:adenylate/guanylate cyclase domain-containing protein n=1 Tax=Rhodomicrobium sp. Az07 TaxID=2839034 RepID=UPI001BEB7332|nr:tetratricopeptide repeat protein [Rhodomicrobium sp. Az07]MBT3071687.1 tetratricopeptide repeat protein [Rhodomicrobium sp. Az07]